MAKHPIKDLGDQLSEETLMQSLERGNFIKPLKGDREDKFHAANPQFKTLNILQRKTEASISGTRTEGVTDRLSKKEFQVIKARTKK
jgi:hypothetical protein